MSDQSTGNPAIRNWLPGIRDLGAGHLVLLMVHPDCHKETVEHHIQEMLEDLQRTQPLSAPFYKHNPPRPEPMDVEREVVRSLRQVAAEEGQIAFYCTNYRQRWAPLEMEADFSVYFYPAPKGVTIHAGKIRGPLPCGQSEGQIRYIEKYLPEQLTPLSQSARKMDPDGLVIEVSGKVASGKSTVAAIIEHVLERIFTDIPVNYISQDGAYSETLIRERVQAYYEFGGDLKIPAKNITIIDRNRSVSLKAYMSPLDPF